MGPSGLGFAHWLGEGNGSKIWGHLLSHHDHSLPSGPTLLLMNGLVVNTGFNCFCLGRGRKRQLAMVLLQQ